MNSMPDRYEKVNTFTRQISIGQVASYTIVIVVLIVFLTAVQKNYDNSNTRIVMVALILLSFCCLVIATMITSKIDPVDPVLVEYRNGDRSKISR